MEKKRQEKYSGKKVQQRARGRYLSRVNLDVQNFSSESPCSSIATRQGRPSIFIDAAPQGPLRVVRPTVHSQPLPSPPSASMKKRINVCEGEVRRVCFGPPRKLCSWRIRVLWEWAMESEDEWWRRFWFVYLFIFLLFGNYGG